MNYLFCFLFSYLIGSVPFGYLLVKWIKQVDIRGYGSHNLGATNVWRAFGWQLGLPTLVLDFLKGLSVLILVPLLISEANNLVWVAAGLLAIVGHVFPLWFWFKGGKGVATAAGVFLALLSLELLIAFITFLLVLLLSRYVVLGSIFAGLTIPFVHFVKISHWFKFPDAPFSSNEVYLTVLCLITFLLVVYTHRSNIKRLKDGNENKVNLEPIFKKIKTIFSATE